MQIFHLIVGCSFFLSCAAFAESCDLGAQFDKANFLIFQRQYLLSSQQYSLIEAIACRDEDRVKARIGYARSLYRLNENTTAEESLAALAKMHASKEAIRSAALLKSWYEPNFRSSLAEYDRLQFSEFENAKFNFEHDNVIKKPWLAGTLSAIIPGAGQAYNGNYQSAALSLILNAVFLGSTIELTQHHLKVPAVAAGLVFSITYTGNILSSVESSRRINENYQAPEIEKLRVQKIPDLEL